MTGAGPDATDGRRKALRVAGGLAFLAAVWLLWDTAVLYPLRLLVVLLHEASHGLASVATGGEIQRIAVTPEEGGYCRCPGGNAFVVLSSGYLGSLAWGALLVRAGAAPRWLARGILGAAGGGILALSLLWVRSPFALALGIGAGALLLATSGRASSRVCRAALTTLGAVSCLYAVLDIKSDVLDRPGAASDAALLAEVTGVPGVVWGVVWIGISLAACAWLLRWAWRRA